MNDELKNEHADSLVLQESKPKLKKPAMYNVVLLNDNFTPMDFVVIVLMNFFSMTKERATAVMVNIHKYGRGICGVFTREIAETKVAQVNAHARSNEYPLLCTMENT